MSRDPSLAPDRTRPDNRGAALNNTREYPLSRVRPSPPIGLRGDGWDGIGDGAGGAPLPAFSVGSFNSKSQSKPSGPRDAPRCHPHVRDYGEAIRLEYDPTMKATDLAVGATCDPAMPTVEDAETRMRLSLGLSLTEKPFGRRVRDVLTNPPQLENRIKSQRCGKHTNSGRTLLACGIVTELALDRGPGPRYRRYRADVGAG